MYADPEHYLTQRRHTEHSIWVWCGRPCRLAELRQRRLRRHRHPFPSSRLPAVDGNSISVPNRPGGRLPASAYRVAGLVRPPVRHSKPPGLPQTPTRRRPAGRRPSSRLIFAGRQPGIGRLHEACQLAGCSGPHPDHARLRARRHRVSWPHRCPRTAVGRQPDRPLREGAHQDGSLGQAAGMACTERTQCIAKSRERLRVVARAG